MKLFIWHTVSSNRPRCQQVFTISWRKLIAKFNLVRQQAQIGVVSADTEIIGSWHQMPVLFHLLDTSNLSSLSFSIVFEDAGKYNKYFHCNSLFFVRHYKRA